MNPDARAGENYGLAGEDPIAQDLTLADIKDAHARLPQFSRDELRRIPVLRAGTRLEQGGTYVDLAGDRTEFTATAGMEAGRGTWIVRKQSVEYPLWNRLVGVRNPERTAADPARGRVQ
jgi:hypothetical protein